MKKSVLFLVLVFGFVLSLKAPIIDVSQRSGVFKVRTIIRAHIDARGDPNQELYFSGDMRTPLCAAVISDEMSDLVGELLQIGASVHTRWRGCTVLVEAAKWRAHRNLALLLAHIKEHEPNPQAFINDGSTTALHLAADRCDCCVEKLLQSGASTRITDRWMRTPLESAEYFLRRSDPQRATIIKLLEDAEAKAQP